MKLKLRQRRIRSLALIILLFIKVSFAQDLPIPKTIADLKTILKVEMEKQHVAGMILTIAENDSVLYYGGLGYSDVEKKIPVTEHQLFRGASITKLFVSLGVLNLINDGKLTLNSRLKDIAPEISFENEWEATNPITVAELLEHTTGFSDKSPFEEYNFSNKKYLDIESVKVFKKYMVSRWKPGERHSYSNVNYAILTYIIEHVSGKPINDYLCEKVFIPLGMSDSNLHLTDDGVGDYCKGYVWKSNHFQEVSHQPQFNAGYGSLNISAHDFSNALIAYLKNWETPEGQFLSKKFLEDSEIPHTYISAKAGFKKTYAYGNECWDINGTIFRGHRGAIGGFLSAFLYNRDLGLGYAFSLNTHNEAFYRFADGIISQFILQSFIKPSALKSYQINDSSIEAYIGYFRLSNPGQLYSGFFESIQNTIKLEQSRNELKVQILGRGSMIWLPADSTNVLFKNKNTLNPQILFLIDSENKPVITDGTMYFKKISAVNALGTLFLFAGSLIIMISTLFYGIINIYLLVFRKIPMSQLWARLSPLFSTLGLLFVLLTIPRLLEHMKDCTPINSDLIWWTIGKYVFAFFLLNSIFLQIFYRNLIKNRWLKIYLIFTGLAGCYLLGLFVVNNWYF